MIGLFGVKIDFEHVFFNIENNMIYFEDNNKTVTDNVTCEVCEKIIYYKKYGPVMISWP